jgi:hypothetical protein
LVVLPQGMRDIEKFPFSETDERPSEDCPEG